MGSYVDLAQNAADLTSSQGGTIGTNYQVTYKAKGNAIDYIEAYNNAQLPAEYKTTVLYTITAL